jgi:hypothetical protein
MAPVAPVLLLALVVDEAPMALGTSAAVSRSTHNSLRTRIHSLAATAALVGTACAPLVPM